MSRFKVGIDLAELSQARDLHAALTELIEPPPLAVTLFEDRSMWRIEAYAAGRSDCDAMVRQLVEMTGLAADRASIIAIAAEDWVARSQAALPPVLAGRFTVYGRHDRRRIPHGPNAIEIEAGEAFGTGHHATTRCCLLALGETARSRPVRRMLDLGCGSGVLAIAAARAWPTAAIHATDIDPVAVGTARRNVRLNGAQRRISVRVRPGLKGRGSDGRRFDLIAANILAGPLIALAKDMARAIDVKRPVILSGLLNAQALPVIATYRASGFILKAHRREAGWSTLTLVRRSERPAPRAGAWPRRGA